MTITHSCCPEKRSIYAPVFTLTETLKTAKGDLQTWTCQGCGTVIMISNAPTVLGTVKVP